MRILFGLMLTLLLFSISACGNNQGAQNETDYEATKKMVVDILQTEDGKKALQEIMGDEKMKKQLVIESDVVKESINKVLVSEKGAEMWAKLFKDPTFIEGFTKSMAEEQKKLFKSLMNDAEFQKQMLELLQNPEIMDQTLKLLKSQQFRTHLEETIQQTLETPSFQIKMQETLLKAAEKQTKKEGGGGGGQGGGEQGGGGGGGGNDQNQPGS